MNRFTLPKELRPQKTPTQEAIQALEAWKLFFKVIFFGLLLFYSGFLTHKYMNSGLLLPEVLASEIRVVKSAIGIKK